MDRAKKVLGSLRRSRSSRSSSSSSRPRTRARAAEQASSPQDVAAEEAAPNTEGNRLLFDIDLDLVSDYEMTAYEALRHRTFAPTRAFDMGLLQKTGIGTLSSI